MCKAKIRCERCVRVEYDTACANTDTLCKSCGVAKRRTSQVPQTQQGHLERAIKSLNCLKHSADTPLASHGGWPCSPGVKEGVEDVASSLRDAG